MIVAVQFCAGAAEGGGPSANGAAIGIDAGGVEDRLAELLLAICAAKASLSSITAMSLRERPASFNALGMALTGPMPNSSGENSGGGVGDESARGAGGRVIWRGRRS